MTVTQGTTVLAAELETPFAEAVPTPEGQPEALGFLPWTETESPFSESSFGESFEAEGEQAQVVAEAFEAIRDEAFDEALAELVGETAEAADQRFAGEQPMQLAGQRFQLADAHLAPIGFEAEQCVQRFADHVQHLDVQGLAPEQLDEVLERFDPGPGTVTPAGEEFIGALIRKAKSVVKTVASAAGKIASVALGPVLNKLKALVRPLLRRVLAMAIDRLPAALHEPARALARRFGVGEAESFDEAELEAETEEELLSEGFTATPVTARDPESLAESFDAALAESVVGGEAMEQGEAFGHDRERGGEPEAGTQLEALAEARSTFMNQLQAAGDHENLGPAVEQFIPAILPALRLGLRLVGRPKVVNFLAGFLAKLIGQWVGPTLSKPLSQAIVDLGLRIIGLEQGQPGELEAEAVPATLAATVEDTVRRVSEQPEHVFEDESLLQVAVAEAFEQAVAANFPSQLVRPDLRRAPTLGGSFVTRFARTPYAYKRYTRVPEVELTEQLAASMRTFRGATVAASLRAAGLSLPGRFRVRLYEAGPGTTLPRLAGLEHILGPSGRRGAYRGLHPLTVANATALLREPGLGVDVPGRFLESRHRIGVGQRFFFLEPVGQGPTTSAATAPGRAASSCDPTEPSSCRIRIRLGRGEARVDMFFSEADAQRIAAAMTARPAGGTAVLRAVLDALRSGSAAVGRSDGAVQLGGGGVPGGVAVGSAVGATLRPGRELEDWLEAEPEWGQESGWGQESWPGSELEARRTRGRWAPSPGAASVRTTPWSDGRPGHHRRQRSHRLPTSLRVALRRQIRAAAARALAEWSRTRAQEFAAAVQDAACGVTVTVMVHGLQLPGPGRPAGWSGSTPAVGSATTVTVRPGRVTP